jgi:hypothetical protein
MKSSVRSNDFLEARLRAATEYFCPPPGFQAFVMFEAYAAFLIQFFPEVRTLLKQSISTAAPTVCCAVALDVAPRGLTPRGVTGATLRSPTNIVFARGRRIAR